MSKIFTGCCLLLPLIILIKLWNFHAKRVAGLWRWRALGDLEEGKTLSGSFVVTASFKLKQNKLPVCLQILMLYALLHPKHREWGKSPLPGTSSWSTSPLNSTQDLWIEAVFLCNNALLIFFFSRVHNEERCLQQLKGKILLATNTLRHPVYILSCVCTFQC